MKKITILATKDDLAELKGGMAELRASTKADLVSIETKITTLATKDDLAELKGGMAELRASTKDDMASIKIQIARFQVASIVAIMAAPGIVIAVMKLF